MGPTAGGGSSGRAGGLALLCLGALCGVAAAAAAARDKPNILFIMVDDLGWNAVAFHGNNPLAHTPNMNRLAQEGISLERYYAYKYCSPSRASFLTGRIPGHDIYEVNPSRLSDEGVNASLTMIPAKLKEAGYATHHAGKWHQGMGRRVHLPINRGFDSSIGYLSGAAYHFNESGGCGFENMYSCCTPYYNDSQSGTDLWEDDQPAYGRNGTYGDFVYTDETIRIIENAASDKGRRTPFFMYTAIQCAHVPLEVPDGYLEKYHPNATLFEDWRIYNTMVSTAAFGLALESLDCTADEAIGNITQALTRAGILNDTVIIISSDNGGPTGPPDPYTASNYPLRGGKYSFFEGGTRVTGIVYAPGFMSAERAGQRYDGLVHISDWYATFCYLAGLSEDECGPTDGFNQWNALMGEETSPRQEVLLGIGNGTKGALLTDSLKLIVGNQEPECWSGQIAPNGTECGSIKPGPCGDQPCLFNLTSDLGEHHDISAEYPEIADEMYKRYQQLVAELGNQNTAGEQEELVWIDGYHYPRFAKSSSSSSPPVADDRHRREDGPASGALAAFVSRDAATGAPIYDDIPEACANMARNGFYWGPYEP